MNIANLFDYIPFRTFTPVNWDTDMSNLERGLNISPWVVYVVGGYLVLFVVWQFFSQNARRILCLSWFEGSLDPVFLADLCRPGSVWIFQLSRIARIWRNIDVLVDDLSDGFARRSLFSAGRIRQWVREKMAAIKEQVFVRAQSRRPDLS